MTYAATIQTYRAGGVFHPVIGTAAVALDIALLAGRAFPWVGAALTGYQLAKILVEAVASDGSMVPVNVLPSGLQQSPVSGETWTGWLKDANGDWQPPVTNASGLFPWHTTSNYYGINPPFLYPNFNKSTPSDLDCDSAYKAYYAFRWGGVPTQTGRALSTYSGNGSVAIVACVATNNGASLDISFATTGVQVCAAGYNLVGNICTLYQANLVSFPSDGKPTLLAKADGTGFALDARDTDNASVSTIPTQITATGINDGNPFRTTISPVTGGGLTATTELQLVNPDGSTSVYRQTATINSTGKIVDYWAGNFPGSLAQQATTTAPVPLAPVSTMPTDYNREATQIQIKTNLDAIKTNTDTALVPLDVSATDIATLDTAQTARNTLKTDIDALPAATSPTPAASLFQPFTPAACSPLSWTFSSVTGGAAKTAIFDLCPWVPTIQRIGAWAMYLLTAAMLFQMFTRRPDGGGD